MSWVDVCCSRRCCLIMTSVLVLIVVAASIFVATFADPWHASCKIQWTVGANCASVKDRLVSQANAWSHANCPGVSDSCPSLPCGQECKYTFVSATDSLIKLEHRTPAKDYLDNLQFELAANTDNANHCSVEGTSSSDLWYAVYDMGTNYCNLRNLMDGSGLSSSDPFVETTSNRVCTQYESRDCSRF